ncbi:MAG: Gfo/Idh/MocA family oxidoreductase [Chloroflexi bacterium]|nr:Gfo/Idh/MocA family oxidoreductase [Chloroflexota bacterium]
MSVTPLRLAVLGAGHIARLVHIPTLAKLPGVHVVAIADAQPQNLAAGLALAPGASGFSDYRAALDAGGLDAAVITLPPALHAEAAIAAFEAGLHVYLEKPLALTLADAERVANAWRASGRVGMIGFNFRFNPLFDEARTALEYGQLGRLAAVRTFFANQRGPGWRADPAAGGSALLEFGTHHVDMLAHLLDSPVVEASAESVPAADGGDVAALALRFASGLTTHSTFVVGAPFQDVYEFMGEKGLLRIARHDLSVQFVPARPRRGKVGRLLAGFSGAWFGLTAGLRSKAEPSYRRALQAFVRAAAAGDASVHPNIADGLAAQRVLDAAARSAAARAPVALDLPPAKTAGETLVLAPPRPGSSPLISMILDKRGPFSVMLPSLRALARQTIAPRIELVVFANSADDLTDVDRDFVGQFERCIAVRHPRPAGETLPFAFRAASAPFVCLYEDHVFPDPDWAETLVKTFENGCMAACTRIANANPASLWSDVGFVVSYGFFTDPLRYDPADDVTFSNGAYRRDALFAFGDDLPRLLKRGGGLNRALVEAGGRLAIARASLIRHANPSRAVHALGLMFQVGRSFAGLKRKRTRMALLKRLINFAAGPLIPFQRFAERIPVMFSGGRNAGRRARVLLALFLGFCAEAAGRMAGYLFGEGRSGVRLEEYDFNRAAYVRKADLHLFDAEG